MPRRITSAASQSSNGSSLSCSYRAFCRSVRIIPGFTHTMPMFCAASGAVSEVTRFATAARHALTAAIVGSGVWPVTPLITTTRPFPVRAIAGTNARRVLSKPTTLIWNWSDHELFGVPRASPTTPEPAAATSPSSRPNSRSTNAAHSWRQSGSRMSTGKTRTRSRSDKVNLASNSRSVCPRRPHSATDPPSRTICAEVAAPIPEAPPVTRKHLPVSSRSIALSPALGRPRRRPVQTLLRSGLDVRACGASRRQPTTGRRAARAKSGCGGCAAPATVGAMTEAAVEIRLAQPSDREALWPLLGALAITFQPDRVAFDTAFDALLAGPDTLVLVAEVPEFGVVGYLVAYSQITLLANG